MSRFSEEATGTHGKRCARRSTRCRSTPSSPPAPWRATAFSTTSPRTRSISASSRGPWRSPRPRRPTPRRCRAFAQSALGAVAVEQALHEQYLRAFGIDPARSPTAEPSPDCLAYTSFLLATAYHEPWEVLVAALLPCFWIYWDVGCAIAADRGARQPLPRLDRHLCRPALWRGGAGRHRHRRPRRRRRRARRCASGCSPPSPAPRNTNGCSGTAPTIAALWPPAG